MRYVICYDVSDDGRRERIASALLDYGRRIQESVFLATLDEALLGRMLARLERLADGAADSVHVFPLCAACGEKVKIMGAAAMPEEQAFYIV